MPFIDQELDSLLNEMNVSIPLRPELPRNREFHDFADFVLFFEREAAYWEGSKADSLRAAHSHFRTLADRAKSAKRQSTLDAVRRAITETVDIEKQQQSELVYSETQVAPFLLGLDKKDPGAAEYATRFATGRIGRSLNQDMQSPAFYKGILLLTLFRNSDSLDSTMRAQSATLERMLHALDEERARLSTEFADATTQARQTQIETSARAQEELQSCQTRFEEAFTKWESSIEMSFKTKQTKLETLEETFREKVRLLKPAEYWDKLARKYNLIGLGWVGGAAVCCVWLVMFVSRLLWFPPESLQKDEVTLSGMKGALIATAAISMLIYLTHLFVRVAVSSFHLARDARERHQLTHVFLALLDEEPLHGHDKEAVKAERTIVYQALFSRADTGLLKNDGTPAMPGPLGNLVDPFKH